MDYSVEEPILELRNICKYFGGIHAVDGVDLELYPGEILALVGDNGAGKSTLIKVISGVHKPTSGDMYIQGQRVDTASYNIKKAKEIGIETVYQDLGVAENLDSAENFFLGRLPTMFRWFVDRRKMVKETNSTLKRLGISIPSLQEPARNLSGGQRQALIVGRAVAWGGIIIILDEPTAALGVEESEKVLKLIQQLKEEGVSVMMISHSLNYVFKVADRIVVLRRGKKVGSKIASETHPNEIVELITGARGQVKY